MNNGKVRIYELSRELNLDNKDILAVCEKLNITAKSHSSTITASEAERIRAAAQKYVGSRSPATRASQSAIKHAQETRTRPSVRPPIRKQQILEVRSKSRESVDTASSAENTSTLKAPANRTSQSSAKLVAPPSRPTRSAPSPQPATADVTQEAVPPSPDQAEEQSHPETTAAQTPSSMSELQDKPKPPVLVKPPARPQTAAERDISSSQPAVAQPRHPSTSVSDAQESAEPAAQSSTDAVRISRPRQPVVAKTVEEDRSSPRSSPAAPKPQRPKVVRSAESAEAPEGTREETRIDEGEAGSVFVESDEGRQRPVPARPPKRSKRQIEVEDEPDVPRKVAKLAGKNKRLPNVDDDDEDYATEQADDAEAPKPAQVSLSLMRPAKPQSHANQTAKSTASTEQSTQKPRKSSAGAPRPARRDRQEQSSQPERPEVLTLTKELTVQELADALALADTEIVKHLFSKGIAVTVTQTLDIPIIKLIAQELGVTVETPEQQSEARKTTEMLDEQDLENLQRRPPVVTIMGHVDHGKTTLLDSIRKTKVAQGEAGGITQHIGAYHVDLEHNGAVQQIVFLDTPGHEAFTAMRARGARVTDIAILVVAADDGVRPQTIEAISHAQAAGVPIVVAINKIDKEAAQPDRVKQELMEHGLVPEEWGGETIMAPVSAITGDNLDTLLEMLLLVAEIEELSANPARLARGTVIEAHLDKARGPVATLLVQNGTLRVGDVLVAGAVFAKVRAMVDDRGERVAAAAPSFAVEILGLSEVPAAGDEFEVFAEEKEARAIADRRAAEQRQSRLQSLSSGRVSLSTLSAKAQEGELKQLNLILKADVQGSLEAILSSLQQLPQDEVQIRVLLSAPGEITETDVDLAAASQAVIIGFNTTFASGARAAADNAGVDVREYDIIYKLLEDIQGAMEGLLAPELVEEPLGQAEVRAVFPVGRGSVAGCYIQSGKVVRNCNIRVWRGDQVVYKGNLDSLRRMKDDVKEVNAGYECGIGLDSFNGWAEGDIIEAFRMVTKRRTLAA